MDRPVLPQPYGVGMCRGVGTQVRCEVGVQKVPGCPHGGVLEGAGS